MENKFQVGDKVSAFGVEGEVLHNNACVLKNFPVVCKFGNNVINYFMKDGKYCDWHKEPSLKLIERPKKKVKKYKVLFQQGADFDVSHGVYTSEDTFNRHNNNDLGIKFIQLIKESEIEVEE